MSSKTVVTAILSLFVIACIIVLVAKEIKNSPETSGEQAVTSGLPAGNDAGENAEPKIIAYYFHGHKRCQTCLSIEAYAKEALDTGFSEDLAKGRLEWRAINTDLEANQHYVQDYELTSSSLVLTISDGRAESKWKNLNEIWPLVHNKASFIKYVQRETSEYLGEI